MTQIFSPSTNIKNGFNAAGIPMPKVINFCGGVQVSIERTKFIQLTHQKKNVTDNVPGNVPDNVPSSSPVRNKCNSLTDRREYAN